MNFFPVAELFLSGSNVLFIFFDSYRAAWTRVREGGGEAVGARLMFSKRNPCARSFLSETAFSFTAQLRVASQCCWTGIDDSRNALTKDRTGVFSVFRGVHGFLRGSLLLRFRVEIALPGTLYYNIIRVDNLESDLCASVTGKCALLRIFPRVFRFGCMYTFFSDL